MSPSCTERSNRYSQKPDASSVIGTLADDQGMWTPSILYRMHRLSPSLALACRYRNQEARNGVRKSILLHRHRRYGIKGWSRPVRIGMGDTVLDGIRQNMKANRNVKSRRRRAIESKVSCFGEKNTVFSTSGNTLVYRTENEYRIPRMCLWWMDVPWIPDTNYRAVTVEPMFSISASDRS